MKNQSLLLTDCPVLQTLFFLYVTIRCDVQKIVSISTMRAMLPLEVCSHDHIVGTDAIYEDNTGRKAVLLVFIYVRSMVVDKICPISFLSHWIKLPKP